MPTKIALVGNPNSGKTTMYNSLTGSNQYVGNWPGVTVEKKEADLIGFNNVILTDLPGIYSLSPYSLEEVITRNYLINDEVDVIINIVDATNIERNLYLTTQLLEINKPVVVALNLIDVVRKRGDTIDAEKLSQLLGCPVIVTSATKNTGLKEIAKKAVELAKVKREAKKFNYHFATIKAIEHIKTLVGNDDQFTAIHLLDQDEILMKQYNLGENSKFKEIIHNYEAEMKTDSQSAIVEERYGLIEKIVAQIIKKVNHVSTSEKIDRIMTNRFLALPIFLGIMFIIYYLSISFIGDLTTGWMEYLIGELIGENVRTYLTNGGVTPWLISLIVDGLIGGVGAVLVFIPQLTILFFFLSVLEDTGYMARIAFIMDRLFRKFGLSGKSFIPMLIGTGCSVPAIMASRTIESERDRRLTIILTPFIPCGAKLPVFALFIGAFFGPLASVSMYVLGIFMVILMGIILKKTKYFKGDAVPFVLELPDYRLPSPKNLLSHIWERVRSFIAKAGTIIFIACAVIWFLQSFSSRFELVSADHSILASIGRFFAPLFAPLGFGNWQSAVAIITGIIAKENVVATFGILLGDGVSISTLFTPISGYAFMAFILLAAPCFAAIGAIKKEMISWKWTLATIVFQTGVAYIVAFLIYQVGTLFSKNPTVAVGLIILVLLSLAVVAVIKNKKCNDGCANCGKTCGIKNYKK